MSKDSHEPLLGTANQSPSLPPNGKNYKSNSYGSVIGGKASPQTVENANNRYHHSDGRGTVSKQMNSNTLRYSKTSPKNSIHTIDSIPNSAVLPPLPVQSSHHYGDFPAQQPSNNAILGLPPVPNSSSSNRRRASSSGDRSVGELSANSSSSNLGTIRVQRSHSGEIFENEYGDGAGGALSPKGSSSGHVVMQPPPKPVRPPLTQSHQSPYQQIHKQSRHGRSHTLNGLPTNPTNNHSTPVMNNVHHSHVHHNIHGNYNGQGHPHAHNPNNGSNNTIIPPIARIHPLKRSSTADQPRSHRRTHSDVGGHVRRGSSSGSLNKQALSEMLQLLPDPRWGGGSGGSVGGGSIGGGSHQRNRSFTGDPIINKGSFGYGTIDGGIAISAPPSGSISPTVRGKGHVRIPSGGGPMHRRTNSELSTTSLASAVSVDQSVEPVVTDLSKSAMFKGATNQGVVRLQLPKDNFRLLSDRDLETGCVYKRQLVDNEDEYFQDYHMTDEAVDLIHHPFESRQKHLPPIFYVMAVNSDIYRRMFDEVSKSMSMPCGFFFCGHHEDVSYPSVMIAAVLVAIVLSLMLVATIYMKG